MSFNVLANNGVLYTAGDINQIGSSSGPVYWESARTTPIDAYNIRQMMIDNGYTGPTIGFDDNTLLAVKNLDGPTIDAFNNDYYWYIGDIQRGGIAFSISSAQVPALYVHRVAFADLIQEANNWKLTSQVPWERNIIHPDGTYTVEHTNLYLNHKFIRNGTDYTGTFGHWMMMTPENGFHVFTGWHIDNIGDTVLDSDCFNHIGNVALNSENKFPILYKDRIYGYLDNLTIGGSVQFIDWWEGLDEFTDDPLYPGGTSEPAGGGGAFDITSDDIPIPELPPDMLLNSGIVKMYAPTAQNMKDFLNYLYSAPDQIITNIKKLWVNPFDSIISFGTVPFKVSAPTSETVRFCGVSTGVSMPVLSSQFMKVSCGSYKFDKFWNSALDHNSYTKIKLFLPFIGFVPLNADEMVGGTITIEYNCDLFTGDCMAFVHVQKNDLFDIQYNGCIYSFKGNIFTQAPLSGSDYTGMYGSILNAVTAVALPSPASIAGIAKEVLGQKVEVQHSNGMSANAGTLGEYVPYLIIERPIQSLPVNFIKYKGYPCNIFYILETLHGYTEVETGTFYTDSIDYITHEEAQELVDMLDKGVVLP